jgi:hypothetical protein
VDGLFELTSTTNCSDIDPSEKFVQLLEDLCLRRAGRSLKQPKGIDLPGIGQSCKLKVVDDVDWALRRYYSRATGRSYHHEGDNGDLQRLLHGRPGMAESTAVWFKYECEEGAAILRDRQRLPEPWGNE